MNCWLEFKEASIDYPYIPILYIGCIFLLIFLILDKCYFLIAFWALGVSMDLLIYHQRRRLSDKEASKLVDKILNNKSSSNEK